MKNFWSTLWKYTAWGLALSLVGFVIFFTERKRPKPEQRTWVLAVALTLMVVGAIVGFGVGDGFFTVSLFDLFKSS